MTDSVPEDASSPKYLEPAEAALLTEFARTCRAAARVVSLYPPAHPAIGLALDRLVAAAGRATANGVLQLQIRGHAIKVDGALVPKADPVVAELAVLLGRHRIGGLALQGGADADSWRTLLKLLARAPEDLQADGGIGHLWGTVGGSSIEILEIDYAEVLRERAGNHALVDDVIEACLQGELADWNEETRGTLMALLSESAHLDALLASLEERLAGESSERKSAAFLNLLKRVAEQLAEKRPDQIDAVFSQLARAAMGLPADTVAEVLRERDSPDVVAGGLNVVGAIVERIDDQAIVDFVARTVVAERSPSARLAEAFQALVPEVDHRRQLLALAGEKVAKSPLADEDSFDGLWTHVETMLTSYTDESYVSSEYAQELSSTREMAIDVDKVSDDPPERVSAWLGTVADGELRGLDQKLLLDLLSIEADPARWRDIAETVVSHAEDLARVGLLEPALELTAVVAAEARTTPETPRTPHALQAIERLGSGPFLRGAISQLRGADDQLADRVGGLCHAIGPAIIPTLAELFSAEQDSRARDHLRHVLAGFGAAGREQIQQLLTASNWEVRRTAAFLLRALGGTESLSSLETLLRDAEPLVQREAIQGILLSGSDEAFDLLVRTLTTAGPRARASLQHELSTVRDERAGPLFAYLVHHLRRGRHRRGYEAAIDVLASTGGPDAVRALEFALYQGDWWAPARTRALRARAAGALRRIGGDEAKGVLEEAAARGPRTTRAAARAELERVREA